ncbi:MAG TPA: hypothetical protein VFT87_00435 [Candidatus Saccharimonadales bacterium]|nr:hypothetical protein [Candidatus Saccharimonadales bacterium]
MQPVKPAFPKNTMPIIFLVSLLLFVSALAGGIWLYVHRANSQPPPEPTVDKSETRNITKVEWIPPAIPSDYVQTDEFTQNVQAIVYANTAAGCTLISRVAQAADEPEKMVLKALDAPGFSTQGITEATPVDFADLDGMHVYPFASSKVEQAVSVPEVSVTSQSVVLYYRQLGNYVASLTVACKSGDDQAAKLQDFIKLATAFKLKTERQ